MRATGHQHEHGRVRGFFQGFEQRVLRLRHEPVRIVNNYNAPPSLERSKTCLFNHLANSINRDPAGVSVLDQNDVCMHAARDTCAWVALPAGVRTPALALICRTLTVHESSKRECDPALTDPVWPAEYQTGWQCATFNRCGDETPQRCMPPDIAQCHNSSTDIVAKS